MNLDFILFTPPKIKYSFMDFWGQVVFIPKMRKRQKEQSSLASFLNCYKASSTTNDVHLTIDAALLEVKGTLDLQSDATEQTSNLQDQQIDRYIPCLFLNSMVGSRYLIIYFHASGQDIKLSYKLLDLLRNLYQINVLAMEYSGYSIYKGKTTSETIKEDSQYVYNYAIFKMGFKQHNIIIMGRSIGTGIALELMQKINPGALVLISPFVSIKSLARQFIGFLGHLIAKETYDNKSNILSVSCPTFFVHGKKDDIISFQNTLELAKQCYNKNYVLTPANMTHANFDFYTDLADPLREFLMHHQFNFYQPNQKGPVISDHLFQWPEVFKF